MEQVRYNTILYEKDEEEPHVAYIILNRPDKTNAISIGPGEMTGELIDAVDRANNDDQVKVLIFKSNGDNFSAECRLLRYDYTFERLPPTCGLPKYYAKPVFQHKHLCPLDTPRWSEANASALVLQSKWRQCPCHLKHALNHTQSESCQPPNL